MVRNRRRPLSPQSKITDMADEIDREIVRDAEIVAQRLNAELPVIDSVHVDTNEFHSYVRRGWGDPSNPEDLALPEHVGFRQNLLDRIGEKAFWDEGHRAFGMTPTAPNAELMGEAPTRIAPPGDQRDALIADLQKRLESPRPVVQRVVRDAAGRISEIRQEPG